MIFFPSRNARLHDLCVSHKLISDSGQSNLQKYYKTPRREFDVPLPQISEIARTFIPQMS